MTDTEKEILNLHGQIIGTQAALCAVIKRLMGRDFNLRGQMAEAFIDADRAIEATVMRAGEAFPAEQAAAAMNVIEQLRDMIFPPK